MADKVWHNSDSSLLNPFTPKSDKFQISPAASSEIWRTWLFIAYSDERLLYQQFSLPHCIHESRWNVENVLFELGSGSVNPFTPESDQCQISPPAPPEILHHTVWRTWLFIAYSDEKWLYYKFSLHHSYNRFLKGWENTLFELRSGSVKRNHHQYFFNVFTHSRKRTLLKRDLDFFFHCSRSLVSGHPTYCINWRVL